MKKTINNDLVWQICAQFFVQGLSFLTAPIFTRLLSPFDYGQLSTYNSWVSIISIFVGMQTYGAIAIAKTKFADNQFKEFLSCSLSISFLSFLILFPFFFFFRLSLGKVLGFPSFVIPFLLIQSFFSFCVTFFSKYLIREKRVKENAFLSIVESILIVFFSLVFIKNKETDKYLGKIEGQVLVIVLFGISLSFVIWKKGRTFYNRQYWSFSLSYCIPLIMHGLSQVIYSHSDKLMLKYYIGEEEAGIYGIVYTLALIVDVIRNSCNSIWSPYYYDYRKNGETDLIKKQSNNYLLFFTIITIGFILLSPEVFKVLAPESYWSGLSFVPLVAFAYYLNFLYTFPVNYELFNAKTKIVALGTTIIAICNIILNVFLIPILGGLGAALSTLLSYFLLLLIHHFNIKFFMKTSDYEYRFVFYLKGLIPVICAVVLYYVLLDYWCIRWSIGVLLGLFLSIRVIRRRSIF